MARNVCWDSGQHHCHSRSIGGPIGAHMCCYIFEHKKGENGQGLPLQTRFTVKTKRFVMAPLGALRTKLQRRCCKLRGKSCWGFRVASETLEMVSLGLPTLVGNGSSLTHSPRTRGHHHHLCLCKSLSMWPHKLWDTCLCSATNAHVFCLRCA